MVHANVPITVGEIVKIKDGSYMICIDPIENKLNKYPNIEGFTGSLVKLNHEYVVIAVNVPCPQEKQLHSSLVQANNCIIKDNENGLIWFCSECNLKTNRNLLE